MLNITILGSCVTRDALEFGNNIKVDEYLSRTSLISIMSKPAERNINISKSLNNFLYRTLEEDINKKHLSKIKETTSDYFIIDFIDERFPLLQKDDYYITFSQYMESHTNALEIYTNKVPRLTMENLSLWINSAKRFVQELKKYYKEENIIIHEAYWAGNDFNAERNNSFLTIYYNFIKILMPKVHVIRIHESFRILNPDHKWGNAPYHYIDAYYQNFILQLSFIISNSIDINNNFTLTKYKI